MWWTRYALRFHAKCRVGYPPHDRSTLMELLGVMEMRCDTVDISRSTSSPFPPRHHSTPKCPVVRVVISEIVHVIIKRNTKLHRNTNIWSRTWWFSIPIRELRFLLWWDFTGGERTTSNWSVGRVTFIAQMNAVFHARESIDEDAVLSICMWATNDKWGNVGWVNAYEKALETSSSVEVINDVTVLLNCNLTSYSEYNNFCFFVS